MRLSQEWLQVKSEHRHQVIDLTHRVGEFVRASEVRRGIVNVFVKHTACALVVGNRRERVTEETLLLLEDIFNESAIRRTSLHGRRDPKAMWSYVQHVLMGSSIAVPVADGALDLGEWQALYLVELAGPATREVRLTLVGD
ncbi:MAG: secondary thiamine-phosphate synthase enzyme YjbQ [Armatimonadota bacterium]|nr:secondary thiamine-phosphate synthase enzyme YjbQ [Armatimonadota bacterium]MDR5696480.1 secondary thiamine-phosphate synthase enzyme YjbQ [Armatimonadota bacterium]